MLGTICVDDFPLFIPVDALWISLTSTYQILRYVFILNYWSALVKIDCCYAKDVHIETPYDALLHMNNITWWRQGPCTIRFRKLNIKGRRKKKTDRAIHGGMMNHDSIVSAPVSGCQPIPIASHGRSTKVEPQKQKLLRPTTLFIIIICKQPLFIYLAYKKLPANKKNNSFFFFIK